MTVRCDYDVAVVGAGPAGLACAEEAARHGAGTVVLDEQAGPGGQIYRSIEELDRRTPAEAALLGADYCDGAALVRRFRDCGAAFLPGAAVWNVDAAAGAVYFTHRAQARSITARRIVIASGAVERAVPVPGWTLPGVMTAGAAQILLKSSGMVPEGAVVLAGTGPLLLLVASQFSAAGVAVEAVVLSTGTRALARALPTLPAALRAPEYLRKGAALFGALRRDRVPIYFGAKSISARGAGKFESLSFSAAGKTRTVEADLLLLHAGVIPNIELARLAGARLEWFDSQAYLGVRRDRWGRTDVARLSVAGDGAAVDGARAAALAGRLCGLEAAHALNLLTERERDRRARPIRRRLARERAVRPFLDALFMPSRETLLPDDPSTPVCRCSEVSVGEIRDAIARGCDSPDQVKSCSRAGMGPCQGRVCGPVVSALVARALQLAPADAGHYGARPPIRPLTLSALAALKGERSS